MLFDPTRWKRPRRPRKVCVYKRAITLHRPPEDVFRFCIDGHNFDRIFPGGVRPEPDLDEMTAHLNHVYPFRVTLRGAPVRWVAHIVDYEAGRAFTDELLEGPMMWWRHTHRCDPAPGGTHYEDIVEYRSYFGSWIDETLVRRELDRVFRYRQEKMKEILHDPSAYP
jgi:ligand-binding SRPBCC domain-containing protein